ncbi:MAG: hypothetical protein WA803_18510, partial [Steroidobacteraceae bacterium]
AVMTAGDVLARLGGNSNGRGVGLRGGTFRVESDASAVHITLNQVRWTEDLVVSGNIDKAAARTGMVRARLQLDPGDARGGELRVEWREGVANSAAAIRGTLGGAAVLARTPAP